ncbi:Cat eye syndrome [Hyphodiscus hymeniophilus]|uniref:adenosine deaminase n=1 Tax=Hyphodiscus hymeniophilus TaxID=353542 RepID=A0A9P7AWF7_9HELO|nr:Cat eye syndrome [Hyphodiscus hymeniophilus]
MRSTGMATSRDSLACTKFFEGRAALIVEEKRQRSGIMDHDHEFREALTPIAQRASAIVSRLRHEERTSIWKTQGQESHELFPGMMFNAAKSHMEGTRLWEIVRKMPKGALLHAHLGATVDLEWVFRTALETPGMCISSSTRLDSAATRQNAMVKFSINKANYKKSSSIWSPYYTPESLIPIEDAASTFPDGPGGREAFVQWMKDCCSITQDESLQHHLGVDDVWKKLQNAFVILCPIIYYEPVMRAFLRQLFRTLLEDGVRWVELRTVFITPFLLEGEESPPTSRSQDLARVFTEEIAKFRSEEEGFWGARFIWTAMRGGNRTQILDDMKQCIEIKKSFPELISGYDLVGQEDLGRTLHDLIPELIWFKEACTTAGVEIPFFFHAGECLGDGDETDQNLFDAVLFGTRRIGHGFSLYKHPLLIDMVKEKNILIESCPISNEVLRYTASILSHPLPALLARGVKAALSNDDPALLGQGTSGVTHDFWQALQGWENLGLEGLWSAFQDQTEQEWLRDVEAGTQGGGIKAKRMQQWATDWETFCQWVVAEFGEKI